MGADLIFACKSEDTFPINSCRDAENKSKKKKTTPGIFVA